MPNTDMLTVLAFVIVSQVPPTITAAQAKSYIGKEAAVCGTVASARWATKTKGKPTFLNLDEPYPKPIFTVVIFEENRSKFSPPPEKKFDGKAVCVHGKIEEFRGVPEIIVTIPKQITEQPHDRSVPR